MPNQSLTTKADQAKAEKAADRANAAAERQAEMRAEDKEAAASQAKAKVASVPAVAAPASAVAPVAAPVNPQPSFPRDNTSASAPAWEDLFTAAESRIAKAEAELEAAKDAREEISRARNRAPKVVD